MPAGGRCLHHEGGDQLLQGQKAQDPQLGQHLPACQVQALALVIHGTVGFLGFSWGQLGILLLDLGTCKGDYTRNWS